MSASAIALAEDGRRAEASRARMIEDGFADSPAGWIDALKAEDLSTRIEAAFLLGRSDDATVIPALFAALEDESARIRVEAALALARLGNTEQAMPSLEHELSGRFFIDAPLRAARALAMLGVPSGYPRVLEALKSPQPSNRMEAIAVLPAFLPFDSEEIGDGTIVDVVAALASAAGDEEPILRGDALTALSLIDTPAARDAIEENGRKNRVPSPT